jgi:acetyl esterase/lipase
LDVYYQPQTEEAIPTIMLLSGTAMLKMYMVSTAEFFVRRGYAVVTFNKGLGEYPRNEQDSFCALAWVHANAETYNFDTERIVLVGFSLGGALAAFLGTVDDVGKYMEDCPHALPEEDYISGVVTVAGFFDYALWIPDSGKDGFIYTYFGPPNQNMETIREASPVNWVDGSEPPFLLVHGENDTVVDPNQSVEFEALLSEAGVDVELLMLPQLIHDNITTSSKALLRINEFLTNLFGSD